MRENVIKLLESERAVAIVRGIAPELCLKVAEALYAGGIKMLEVTYDMKHPETAENTANAIARIKKEFGSAMSIGAGTVTAPELVRLTSEAGGEYIVSPDTNIEVIRETLKYGLVSMPGAMTPTEIMTAHNAGADVVKLFPASNLGPSYVKAIRAPLSHVKLMATGGINAANIPAFLDSGIYAFGIGGNLSKREWIENGEFDKLRSAAAEIVAALKG